MTAVYAVRLTNRRPRSPAVKRACVTIAQDLYAVCRAQPESVYAVVPQRRWR